MMLINYFVVGIFMLQMVVFNIAGPSPIVFCRGKRGWGHCIKSSDSCPLRRYYDKMCRDYACCAQ